MIDKQALTGVTKVADLVDYQAGTIVSRILMKEPTGSVTAFAFDAGQDLSEHTVPHQALVYLLDGEAEISIAGEPHRLRRGDMLILPAGKPHAVRAVARFKMVLTLIRPPASP